MEKPETGTGAEDDGRRKHRLARSRRTAGQNRERGFAMNRILIIDDDRELCVLIKRSVLSENIEADFCSTGKAGLLKLREREYQLVILDVMMPGMDGFETLEEIRKESSLPILMFTSRNDSISKVRGLRAGADDYLTKPFDMEELIARIVSLIRRYTRFNQPDGAVQKLVFDGLEIDPEARLVTAENGTLELPPKEFDLLLYCAKNQGKILTKKQIYENVWGDEYLYDDSNIMAVISRLRKNWRPLLQAQSISRPSKGSATALIRRYSWYGDPCFSVHSDCGSGGPVLLVPHPAGERADREDRRRSG